MRTEVCFVLCSNAIQVGYHGYLGGMVYTCAAFNVQCCRLHVSCVSLPLPSAQPGTHDCVAPHLPLSLFSTRLELDSFDTVFDTWVAAAGSWAYDGIDKDAVCI